jgi:hypothetical protein
MPPLTEPKLDQMAKEVVAGLTEGGVPLTDGVVKVAERENLGPEQIKRLVETTNNMTFLHKFNAAEPNAADRMVEFEPADAQGAIQRMLDAAKDLMNATGPGESADMPCPSSMGDLPMTRPDAPEPLPEAEPEVPGEPKVRGTVVIMKLRKTAELLKEKQYQARTALTDTFQKLATAFTKLYGPDFPAFEKDAFYHWGDSAVPHLTLLRRALNQPVATYDHGVMTKSARVVDTSTEEMRLFRQMMKHSEEIEKLGLAQTKNAEFLARAEKCPS